MIALKAVGWWVLVNSLILFFFVASSAVIEVWRSWRGRRFAVQVSRYVERQQ
jgi:hypothetical protein